MAEEFACVTCGKRLRTAAGLAGHRMLAHPAPKEPASGSPEQALVEMLECVREAYRRLQKRLEDFTTQLKSLVAQLDAVDGRLDRFRSSFNKQRILAEAKEALDLEEVSDEVLDLEEVPDEVAKELI